MAYRIRRLWLFVGACSLAAAYLFVHIAPPIDGIIIDTESGAPIQDAVLLIGWREFSLEGSGYVTRGVHEIVADSNGKFSAPVRISFGIESHDFQDMHIGVVATGYVSDTRTVALPDPYIKIKSTWWGKKILSLEMERPEFNRTSLLRLAKTRAQPASPPPIYLPNGEYYTLQRADGTRLVSRPHISFGLSLHDYYSEYPNFWCRSHVARVPAATEPLNRCKSTNVQP